MKSIHSILREQATFDSAVECVSFVSMDSARTPGLVGLLCVDLPIVLELARI